jgi:hypothetical protein
MILQTRFVMSPDAAPAGASAPMITTDVGGWNIDNEPAESAPEVVVDDSDDFPAYQDEAEINEADSAEGTSDSGEASDTQTQTSEPVFKEYTFKGKVNGEEVTQEFKSQKDLDRTLARGLLAPKIHEAYTQLQNQYKTVAEDAEWASSVHDLATRNPSEFFKQVVLAYTESGNEAQDKAFDAALAEFVHDRYQHYSKLASMPEEQLKQYRQMQTAERILRENARLQELAEENQRQAEQARVQREKAEFEGWKQRELNNWYTKVSDSDRETVNEYLKIVATYAHAQLAQGVNYTWDDMSKHLSKLCDPLVRLKSVMPAQSSAQKRQEELATNQNRAAQNKEALRKQAGNPQGNKPRLAGAALHKGAVDHIMKKFFNQ